MLPYPYIKGGGRSIVSSVEACSNALEHAYRIEWYRELREEAVQASDYVVPRPLGLACL